MFRKNCNCIIISAISAVLGIIAGVITYFVAIPGIITAIWLAFGLSAGILVLVTYLLTRIERNQAKCLCEYTYCLPIGIIGTILTAILALAIGIVVGSISRAILVGLGLAFTLTTLFSFIGLIICLMKTRCTRQDNNIMEC